ncbi:hypothetical protein [Planotetraspora mira]|uniref:Uncharacterized protein n=1 Tax=Planotetraspora mira TaxID=58121 RepID=A0A8J3TLY2_9ACTN|nr:hypothetical protein [Planotetraspora mira]GII28216.1 hypothetical protein Pmi06nite_16580 [Planotetraspora mira]
MGTFDRRRGQDDRDPGHTRLKRLTVLLSVLAVAVTAAVLAVVISVDASRRRPAPSPHPDTVSPTPEAMSAPVLRHLASISAVAGALSVTLSPGTLATDRGVRPWKII